MHTLVILIFKYSANGLAIATEHIPGFETLELCNNAGRAIVLGFKDKQNHVAYVCVKTKETKE